MPYQRRRRTTRTGMVAGSRRSGYPRLSRNENNMIRLEKSGIDVVPRLLTQIISTGVAGVNQFTFSGTADGIFAINPMYQFYTNCPAFTVNMKSQYKEFRMKQCKVHAMLDSVTGAALTNWNQGAPLVVAYGWQRNISSASAAAGTAYSTMALQPDVKQKVWTIAIDKPEFWTSCTASSSNGEGNWLACTVAPNTGVNSGAFFAPNLLINVELSTNAASGLIGFTYELEYVIEFRGSLQ